MMHESTSSPWAVIFDMDGVLIDSYRAHFVSWQTMLRRQGLDITEAQFAATFGRTNQDVFAELYPSIAPEDYNARAQEKEDAFREILRADFPAMDGASELIHALHAAGAILAIGSSGPPENIQATLDLLDGAEHISATTNGTEVRRGKPDPEVFLTAAEKINVPPQRCIVVEDAPAGVAAAKAAGMTAVALTGTATSADLAAADRIVTNLRELTPQHLKQMISGEQEKKR